MTTPGPDHPITLERGERRWRARYANRVIADTDDALILREAGHPPVVYFPRHDVAMEYMGRSEHHTHCPHKGDAAYYTLRFAGELEENIAWSYENPLEPMDRIGERIAFDTARVEIYDIDDAVVNPHHREDAERREEARARDEMTARDEMMVREEVNDVIQHTDSGSGASQREHWDTNVSMPDREEGGMR